MPDAKNLPKWAQHEIQRLEHNVEYWKALATAGPEDSNTFVRHTTSDDKPLGTDERIRFQLDHHQIIAHVEENRLYVYGGGPIAVYPHSSNVLYLGVIE